ncbi:MAG: ATP-binding cassette domain-containing protein [Methanosarcinaceae archaeon]|nr:ATP-binding cassette domain-containing protein [Methanosarcinaceae archaeon]NKQ39903.1 ATP-binding cassette domain-containing protein [Methanosarcinales archaeon]
MIEIENLGFKYKIGEIVLNNINLTIKRSEFIAIIGGNGCGKTTLVRHLNALQTPCKGSVKIDGLDSKNIKNIQTIRQTVGMVFQDAALQFIGTTLKEDIAFGLENLALSQKEIVTRVDKALHETGLQKYRDYHPKHLSGGQMQMAAITGVLAMNPTYIVFDEVTSMLDKSTQKIVMDLIYRLKSKGKTIILCTHKIDEILRADRVILMNKGNIVSDTTPNELFKNENIENFGIEVPDLIKLKNALQKINKNISIDSNKNMNLNLYAELLNTICQLMSKT